MIAMLKVKVLRYDGENELTLDQQINNFIKDKNVIDIKISTSSVDDLALVIYKEDGDN